MTATRVSWCAGLTIHPVRVSDQDEPARPAAPDRQGFRENHPGADQTAADIPTRGHRAPIGQLFGARWHRERPGGIDNEQGEKSHRLASYTSSRDSPAG
jgi:hypothetical protein